MSIITLATTKGGAGKTTLARLILACLAPSGIRLAALDADENRTLTDWVTRIARQPITVVHQTDAAEIVPQARKLHAAHDLVVIDTAGAHTDAMILAMGLSHLVLVPLQPSLGDVVEAIKTCKLIASAGELVGREIPARVVLMATQPTTNVAERIETDVVRAGLPLMQTRLSRLVAFQELSYSGLAPAAGTAGAQAAALIAEIAAFGVLPEPAAEKIAS